MGVCESEQAGSSSSGPHGLWFMLTACLEKQRTCSLPILPPGQGLFPRGWSGLQLRPTPTGSCPLCAGIRGAMPPPFFPMSWKKLAG